MPDAEIFSETRVLMRVLEDDRDAARQILAEDFLDGELHRFYQMVRALEELVFAEHKVRSKRRRAMDKLDADMAEAGWRKLLECGGLHRALAATTRCSQCSRMSLRALSFAHDTLNQQRDFSICPQCGHAHELTRAEIRPLP